MCNLFKDEWTLILNRNNRISKSKFSPNLAQNTDFWVAHRQNACVSMQNRGQTSGKQAV